MKKIYFLGLVLLQITVYAQPSIQWEKSLGGSQHDEAYSIRQTNDGGYIVAGWSMSNDGDLTGNNGYSDYWIVKLDVLGNIQWQNNYGGSLQENGRSVEHTKDGGYIVAGYTSSHDGIIGNLMLGGSDYWILKLDSAGNIQWNKCLGGTWGDEAYSIRVTRDGGYIVAGMTWSSDSTLGDVKINHGYSDYWIVKLDTVGNIQWQKSLGGSQIDIAESIDTTNDGGYIIAGHSGSNDGDASGFHGTSDYWIVKLDSIGNIQWQKMLGGPAQDEAYSIQQTKDGGYIIAGLSIDNGGDVTGNHGNTWDYWIIKLNIEGNIEWQKSLGGSRFEAAYSVIQTDDGGYAIAGNTSSEDGDVIGRRDTSGNKEYWILKLDKEGKIEWQKCLGGNSGDSYARCIQQTSDGGFIVAGSSGASDGDVTGHHGFSDDYWIVKLSPEVGIHELFENENSLIIYPAPLTFSSTLQLSTPLKNAEVIIYDMLGKEMMRKRFSGSELKIEKGSLVSGVYFVKVRDNERQWVEKIVVE